MVFLDASSAQHGKIERGIAFRWIGNENHAQIARGEANVQLPRDGEAVAAIVAFAAHHDDALFGNRREMRRDVFHHARGRVFHEDDAGNSRGDRGTIHFRHLGRREDFSRPCAFFQPGHTRPRAMTTVISSGSSGAVLHCVTASMIFATISFGSLFW